jgi:hypothetical protein
MPRYRQTEERIGRLTLGVGIAAAAGSLLHYPFRIGVGVLVGAVFAWLNYRWLKGALEDVARVSIAQAGTPQARLPMRSLAKLLGRYLLIGVCAYVIFVGIRIPVLSMLVGMCALGAATIGASLYEIFESRAE